MVWQYNVPVIVMLTECTEKGTVSAPANSRQDGFGTMAATSSQCDILFQERSACYWPAELRTSETFDKYLIELAVERNSTHYSYRDLYITNTEVRER